MSNPTFKSFITEKEIEDVKKKRQEEWEKVRKPDQPLGKSTYIASKEQMTYKECQWNN